MNTDRTEFFPEEESAAPQKPGRLAEEIYSILRDFSVILAVVAVVFVFVVRLVGVSGSSMYPTLVDKDYMLVLSNFISDDYKNGDVVVMTVPTFSEDPIVKRVIATAGQTVDIDFETATVYVDGVALDEPYICEPTHTDFAEGLTYPAVVPEGCIFVLGDNRNHSTDSRYGLIGMVDTRYVMGRVICIALPGRQTDNRGNVTGGRDFSRIGGLS